MDKIEIVEQLGKERRVERMVESIAHQPLSCDLEDLAQMVYLVLLEYREDLIIDLWENGQINFFLARVILNQYHSTTSAFHTQIRKFREMTDTIYGEKE